MMAVFRTGGSEFPKKTQKNESVDGKSAILLWVSRDFYCVC